MNMFLCLLNAFMAGINAVHFVQNTWNHNSGLAIFNLSVALFCLSSAIMCYGK